MIFSPKEGLLPTLPSGSLTISSIQIKYDSSSYFFCMIYQSSINVVMIYRSSINRCMIYQSSLNGVMIYHDFFLSYWIFIRLAVLQSTRLMRYWKFLSQKLIDVHNRPNVSCQLSWATLNSLYLSQSLKTLHWFSQTLIVKRQLNLFCYRLAGVPKM